MENGVKKSSGQHRVCGHCFKSFIEKSIEVERNYRSKTKEARFGSTEEGIKSNSLQQAFEVNERLLLAKKKRRTGEVNVGRQTLVLFLKIRAALIVFFRDNYLEGQYDDARHKSKQVGLILKAGGRTVSIKTASKKHSVNYAKKGGKSTRRNFESNF